LKQKNTIGVQNKAVVSAEAKYEKEGLITQDFLKKEKNCD